MIQQQKLWTPLPQQKQKFFLGNCGCCTIPCATGSVPFTLYVHVSGATNDTCASCAGDPWNGSYACDKAGGIFAPFCIWQYSLPATVCGIINVWSIRSDTSGNAVCDHVNTGGPQWAMPGEQRHVVAVLLALNACRERQSVKKPVANPSCRLVRRQPLLCHRLQEEFRH